MKNRCEPFIKDKVFGDFCLPCDCSRLEIWKASKSLCAFGSITISYEQGCAPVILVSIKDSEGKKKTIFVPKHNTRVIVVDDLASIEIECSGKGKKPCVGKFVISFTACCKNSCKHDSHVDCVECHSNDCHDCDHNCDCKKCDHCQKHDCCCHQKDDHHSEDWDQEYENYMMFKHSMNQCDESSSSSDNLCPPIKRKSKSSKKNHWSGRSLFN